jgi:hypothetical protein
MAAVDVASLVDAGAAESAFPSVPATPPGAIAARSASSADVGEATLGDGWFAAFAEAVLGVDNVAAASDDCPSDAVVPPFAPSWLLGAGAGCLAARTTGVMTACNAARKPPDASADRLAASLGAAGADDDLVASTRIRVFRSTAA